MIDPRAPDYSFTPASHRRPALSYRPRDSASASPACTVVTPFFNTGAIFRETAASIFNQSQQNFEWLIVDDGSTDPEAAAILDEFRSIDPRVRVVNHPVNRGLSAARNTGFRDAASPFVILVDSDDLIEPTTLEKCVWYLHTHPEAHFVKGYTVGFGAQEYLWTRGFHEGREFLRENLATATTMIRRSAWEAVSSQAESDAHSTDTTGGFDESNRAGMEDWEFWIRCAARGLWGATIPEYLDWYRRRAAVAIGQGPWANLTSGDRVEQFRRSLRSKYPDLYANDGATFPSAFPTWPMPFEPIRDELPLANPVDLINPSAAQLGATSTHNRSRRLMLIAPWLTLGGADKFNLAMIRELTRRGWSVSIATTVSGDHSWLPEFTRITPDIFAMPHFLRAVDQPAFLRYLIESRKPDFVMVSNSELGYHVIPYLRAHCPEPTFVDLSHMEEPWWKNGGHPRYAVGACGVLDLNIAVSEHLKEWMIDRGAERDRVEVCYVSTCEDPERLTRNEAARERLRSEQGIEPESMVILYAGRLVQQKQPRVYAQTMRLLAEDSSVPSFTALVAGDGPDLGYLREFMHKHRLDDRVRLLGAIPQERMRDYLSASDIFFLPSQWEGIALSIYEAMAMGLAVVGADVGGQRELVTQGCGVLRPRCTTEIEEAERYAEELARLLADPAGVRAMGERARQRVNDGFTPEALGDRLEVLFDRAAELHRTTPRPRVSPAFGAELATRGVEYIRAFSLAEVLWGERDNLRGERDTLRAHASSLVSSNGHLPIVIDPAAEAKRIIESNMRYRAADKVNSVLKSIGVHAAIKVVTVRALRLTGKRPR